MKTNMNLTPTITAVGNKHSRTVSSISSEYASKAADSVHINDRSHSRGSNGRLSNGAPQNSLLAKYLQVVNKK